MEGSYRGAVGEAGAGAGRPVRAAGAGGPGGSQAAGDGSRSWRGGGGWSFHPISAEAVASLRRQHPAVLELPEDLVRAARGEWEQVTVVARSLGRRVPVEWLAKDISARLGLRYEAEVFVLAEDHLALRFRSPEDRDRALTGGPWVVAGQLMAMEAWKAGFVPGPGSISSAAVWVRLPKLPMEFWGKEILMRIAAVAGRPLEADEFTGLRRRMGFARVKLVVDTSKPLVPGVLIRGDGEVFWQAFVYESLPMFCFGCGRIGHGHDCCPFGQPAQPGEVEVRGDGPSPVEGSGGSSGSREQGACGLAFGPWLATEKVRVPGMEKPKQPGQLGVEKLKKGSDLPVTGAGRPETEKAKAKLKMVAPAMASSPQPDGGWLKPAKVARRRSPGKTLPAADGGGAEVSGRRSSFAPLAELEETCSRGACLGASLGLNSTGLKRPRSPLGLQRGGQKGGIVGGLARGPRGRPSGSSRAGGDGRLRKSGAPTDAGSGGPSGTPAARSTVGLGGEEEPGIMVDGIFRAGGPERVSDALGPRHSVGSQVLEAGDTCMTMGVLPHEEGDLGAGRELGVEGREEVSGVDGSAATGCGAGEVSHSEAVARAKAALSMPHQVEGDAPIDESTGEGDSAHCESHSMEVVMEPLPGDAQGSLLSEVQQ